jgi:hypothetical protein
MNSRITRNRLFIAPAGVVLAAIGVLWGAGWLQPAKAQTGEGSVRFVSYACIGIVYGQKLRFSVGNAAEPTRTPVVWTYLVTNPGSGPVFESERIPVPSGEFRSRDITYTGLDVAGEPETGRVQMMVQITVDVPSGIDESDVIGSLEIIDEETGQTGYVGWIKLSPDA